MPRMSTRVWQYVKKERKLWYKEMSTVKLHIFVYYVQGVPYSAKMFSYSHFPSGMYGISFVIHDIVHEKKK